MEKKEFNRYFNFHVKTLFERFNSDHIIIEYSKNMAKLKFRNENVGNIEFKFLTGKQLSVGAIASVFMTAKVFGGDVWREIVECDKFRKKETNVYNNYLYSFYSSSSNSPFFRNSKTDFFPSDDIKEKLCGFLDFVSKEMKSSRLFPLSYLFQKNQYKCDIVPSLPTGLCGVEPVEYAPI